MKNFRSVFILLLGMISITAFATTSKLDQKQETAFDTDHSVLIDVAHVDSTFDFVSIETQSLFSDFTFTVRKQTFAERYLSVYIDVGWQSDVIPFDNFIYKENIIKNHNLNFTNKADSRYRIRSSC